MHDTESLSLNFIALIWTIWCAAWFVLSLGVKPAVRHESRASRLLHLGPLGLAILLLIAGHRSFTLLAGDVLPQAAWMAPAGAALRRVGARTVDPPATNGHPADRAQEHHQGSEGRAARN